MKARWMLVSAVVLALAGFAQGPAQGPRRAPGLRGEGPRLERMAETLGMRPEALKQALRQGGLPALLAKKGWSPKAFQERLLDRALRRLEEAYAAGRISKLRYQALKARLEARRRALAAPTLAELVQKSGGDLAKLKEALVAVWRSEIEARYRLGLLSPREKGRLLAGLERRAERFLSAPVSARPGRAFHPRARRIPRGRGKGFPRRGH